MQGKQAGLATSHLVLIRDLNDLGIKITVNPSALVIWACMSEGRIVPEPDATEYVPRHMQDQLQVCAFLQEKHALLEMLED